MVCVLVKSNLASTHEWLNLKYSLERPIQTILQAGCLDAIELIPIAGLLGIHSVTLSTQQITLLTYSLKTKLMQFLRWHNFDSKELNKYQWYRIHMQLILRNYPEVRQCLFSKHVNKKIIVERTRMNLNQNTSYYW